MDNKVKLGFTEIRDITIEAGLNLIPSVGGSLAAIYFGAKQELRFKRIERFYNELADEFGQFQKATIDLEKIDKEELASLIEEINEGVEKDFLTEKMQYFKNCFHNVLSTKSDNDSYRKRKFFIYVLSILSLADLDLMSNLYKCPEGEGYPMGEDDKFSEFNASLEKLKSYGFVYSYISRPLKMGSSWGEISTHSINQFGRDFCHFCLETNYDNKIEAS